MRLLMNKVFMGLSFSLLSWLYANPMTFAATNIQVFVSFSMPSLLLEETLKESSQLNIPSTLNGFYQNSMSLTTQKIMEITTAVPNLQLQIDSTAFEHYAIHQVPALVVDVDGCFDVIYGHLSLAEGLSRIARKGSCGYKRSVQ